MTMNCLFVMIISLLRSLHQYMLQNNHRKTLRTSDPLFPHTHIRLRTYPLSGILPVGMDIGDLLLILVLLLLYLEKEDEEILIILSVLIFMGFK